MDVAVEHARNDGLPFVGQAVSSAGYASAYGVNRVRETGDPTAHAEIVAMRLLASAWRFDYRVSYASAVPLERAAHRLPSRTHSNRSGPAPG